MIGSLSYNKKSLDSCLVCYYNFLFVKADQTTTFSSERHDLADEQYLFITISRVNANQYEYNPVDKLFVVANKFVGWIYDAPEDGKDILVCH